MRIPSLFHGFQVSRCRTSWRVASQYREGSRVRCGGGVLWSRLGLAEGSPRTRARVQGEATVYEDPFTLSRFASTPRSNELARRKPVSRKFTGALRRGRFVASAGAR